MSRRIHKLTASQATVKAAWIGLLKSVLVALITAAAYVLAGVRLLH